MKLNIHNQSYTPAKNLAGVFLSIKLSILLLVLVLDNINLCAQQSIQDYLQLDTIIAPGITNYDSPRQSLKLNSFNNKLIIFESYIGKQKGSYICKGYLIDLVSKKSQSIELKISSKLCKPNSSVQSIAIDSNHIIINTTMQQFLFKKKSNSYLLKEVFEFSHMTGESFLTDGLLITTRQGYIDKSLKTLKRVIQASSIYNGKILSEDEIKIKGSVLYNSLPSKFVAANQKFITWIDPINYTIYWKIPRSADVNFIRATPNNWEQISDSDLKFIESDREVSDILVLLRAIRKSHSTIWKIYTDNKEQLYTIHNNPNNSRYNFSMDILKLNKAGVTFKKENLQLDNYWQSFPLDRILTKENFPARFDYVGNEYIFTENYACILTEENNAAYKGKTYSEYFMTDVNSTYGLKLHIFSTNFE